MTPEQHNTLLGSLHLVYAGFLLLMMFIFIVAFGGAFWLGRTGPDGPPLIFMLVVWTFVALIYAALTIPSFIAGFGLLKRKKWAKTAAIVAGVFAATSFPFGTALCVYTFWFLFSEPGRAILAAPRLELPVGRQSWLPGRAGKEKEVEYIPPSSPPDWR